MTTILSWLIPWAGPRATMALMYALVSIIVIGGPAGAVYIHMRGKMASQEMAINAEWKAKLADARNEYIQIAADAISGALSVSDTPGNIDDLKRLCAESAACRDRAKPGK